jgi:uncharacterized protein (DUF58 family)
MTPVEPGDAPKPPRHSRAPIQAFRIATLVVPPALAWNAAFAAPHPSALTVAVTRLLGPLWVVMAGALLVRTVDALVRRRVWVARHPGQPPAPRVPLLEQLDVLTASGSATLWASSAAIVLSVSVGWASLSVVGIMGLCFVQLVVLWTVVVAGGDDPFRVASLARSFVPARATEGDRVIEEVRLTNPRIPTGFRLFAAGRIGPRWAVSRYVVGESASGGELVMESDVGPALRGEHRAPPLDAWLQDVFGLCRSVRRTAGEASLTVLPRLRPVDGVKQLLGTGGHDLEPRPAAMPTEGSLRLREYAPGDDARRIHWVRSLAARQVVVRLPDETPPEKPAIDVVLDTFLEDAGALSCAAHDEVLDALVKIWLGVGQALIDGGARVTLVTAAAKNGRIEPLRRKLTARAMPDALRLGAEVRWQGDVRVDRLLPATRRPTSAVVVSYRLQPDPEGTRGVRWILAPVSAWSHSDEALPQASTGMLPHPAGSADNRWSRRRRERIRIEAALRDRITFLGGCGPTRDRASLAGSFCARPAAPARIRLEAL